MINKCIQQRKNCFSKNKQLYYVLLFQAVLFFLDCVFFFFPGFYWMHETSAWGWYTGKTQRDGMEREAGGGIRMGNTCKSMADSCQCMAKTTTIL